MRMMAFMLGEKKNLEELMKNLEAEMKSLPQGLLECRKTGRYWQWYHYKNGHCSYIKKKEGAFAQQLALKTYRKRQWVDCKGELAAIRAYIKMEEKKPRKTAKSLLANPGFRQLLLPLLGDLERKMAEWETQPYRTNPFYLEGKIIDTPYGFAVRSKSELLILIALKENGICVRYECEIIIGGRKEYPDFLILHPKTGELIIWEHLGMMDDPDYARHAVEKIRRYAENGWVLGQNLILTAETKDKPLSARFVKAQIEYLLA